MRLCTCGADIPSIDALNCGKSFGQIQRLIFQKVHNTTGKNGVTVTSAGTLSTWTALFARSLTGATKAAITPYVEAPTQEGGDAITFGGGNDTLGGTEEIVGRNASKLSFALRKYPSEIIAALKQMECEPDLGVYLVGEFDEIEGIKESETSGSTTTEYLRPIPIRSFFVGDKIHGGLTEPDSNALSFNFLPNYSDNLAAVSCPGILSYAMPDAE